MGFSRGCRVRCGRVFVGLLVGCADDGQIIGAFLHVCCSRVCMLCEAGNIWLPCGSPQACGSSLRGVVFEWMWC